MTLTTPTVPRHYQFAKPKGGSFALVGPFGRATFEGFFMSNFHRVPGRGVNCGTVSGIREDRGHPFGPSSTVSLFFCGMKRPNAKPKGVLR